MGYTSNADGGEKNWLERLGEKIPGYAGYQAKERRRDVDKLHRETLADRVRGTKAVIATAVRDLTDGGRLFEVGPLERISKKVDTIENRIRFASYGYSGFFDVVQIKEEQLDRIYRFDLGLVEKVEEVERQAAALNARGSAEDLKGSVETFERAVDSLAASFDTRHQAINGYGAESAPGRPLFQ